MRPGRIVLLCAALAFALVPSAAGSSRTTTCTWGASSIQAQVVDGRVVQSRPVTTGCTR